MKSKFIFGRDEETQNLHARLVKKRPFLVHGPAGAGKTLLLRNLLCEFPDMVYCENAATTQVIFRTVARALLQRDNARVLKAVHDEVGIKMKSAVSLKGIVMDALHTGKYCIVLDHLKRPSYSLASAVREIMGWAATPVVAVARSPHMEDVGFLQPFYSDKSEKYEIRNFEPAIAEQFVQEIVRRNGLFANNMRDFLEKVLEFSHGNPGAILAMMEMAGYPKYRSEENIKITPLYIDFRMNWGQAGSPRK